MSTVILHVGAKRARWWKENMQSLLPEFDVALWDDPVDPDDVAIAVVWRHPPGGLVRFTNLKAIVSIGAGIDHVLVDPDLPKGVPIIRTTGPDLTQRMREYVSLQVLRLHRRLPEIEAAQHAREWLQPYCPPAPKRRVGIMGLGNLGADCARTLAMLGFDVAGWARRPKSVAGVTCFAGDADEAEFLARTEILVCLLPATPATDGILCRSLFERLPRGASIINCSRGELLVEDDLIPALEEGVLEYAVLDVFRTEPLPPESPFWTHPRILITPHVASLIDPEAGGRLIAGNIRRFLAGEAVPDLVDLAQGY